MSEGGAYIVNGWQCARELCAKMQCAKLHCARDRNVTSSIVRRYEVHVELVVWLQALGGCDLLSGCFADWAPGTRVPGDPAAPAAGGRLDTTVGSLAALLLLGCCSVIGAS